jgi:hypothetical protein
MEKGFHTKSNDGRKKMFTIFIKAKQHTREPNRWQTTPKKSQKNLENP